MIDAVSPLVTGLFLWLKADSITGIASGAPLPQWQDSSSSHLNAIMINPKLQPTLISNSFNGKPSVEFKANQKLSTPAIQVFLRGSDSLTVFLAFETQTADQIAYLLKKSSPIPANNLALAINAGSDASGNIGIQQYGTNAVISNPDVILPNHFYILALSVAPNGTSPDNIAMEINGTSLAISKSGTGWLDAGNYPTDMSPVDIGGGLFSGRIAEVMAFSHQLSKLDLARTGCYLGVKYQIAEASSWCSKVGSDLLWTPLSYFELPQ